MNFEIYPETLKHHKTWSEAIEVCSKLEGGWRLPTKEELLQILELQRKGEISLGNYGCWSSTEEGELVWSIGFLTGNRYLNPKTNLNLIRPVRDIK